MKSCLFLLLLVALGGSRTALADPEADQPPAYDPALASEVGADAWGMRPYVLALLKAGPNRPTDPEQAQALQRAHLDNIRRLADEGVLVLAGPFIDDGTLKGIYVFAVSTVAEAEALTATDPAVQAGSLVMELHPWYGSAALMKLNEWHQRIAREQP
ncbi:MAG: hypothetical protein Kow0020_09370 [Wenzhouxiangellaceae bacterium]